MVGLITLVARYFDDSTLVRLTIAFSVPTLSILIITFLWLLAVPIITCFLEFTRDFIGITTPSALALSGLMIGITAFCLLVTFYSDWALAIMTKAVIGLPSTDVSWKLTVAYMVVKRLPLFSW